MTVSANTAAWFAAGDEVTLVEPPQTEVRVDGRVEPRICLDGVEMEFGQPPRARFSVGFGLDPLTGEDLRLEQMVPRLRPGARVLARLLRGGDSGDLVLFDGCITRLTMGLESDGERLGFEAEDTAGEILRRRVGGRRVRTAGGTVEHVDGLALVFNPEGVANASGDLYDPGSGEPYTVFAPAVPDASAWTLDAAVAYLVAEHGRSTEVAVPTPSEIAACLPAIIIRDVSLEGRTLGAALDALLELVGGRVAVLIEPGPAGVSRRLELLLPDRAPTAWLAYQPVGSRFDPAATSLAGLAVEMHFESAPRRYVARGDRKIYESTFDLVPGWNDALASYDPDLFSPSHNPGFDAVRDVFRKWVLNEAGEFSAAPYNRGQAPDLSGVFQGESYVRRHRRLMECLSRDGAGRSYGVHVEVSQDGGASWERPGVSVRVLPNECGVYFRDDPLPSRYLLAAMSGQVRVRVTAAIESDACLVVERTTAGAEDLPGLTRHINAPAGYRFRRVAPSSRFHGGAADEADDTQRLQELLDAAHAADRFSPAPSRIDLPCLAMGYRLGQRILGLRGRELDFVRQYTGYEAAPRVRRVRWTFAPEPRTELELE